MDLKLRGKQLCKGQTQAGRRQTYSWRGGLKTAQQGTGPQALGHLGPQGMQRQDGPSAGASGGSPVLGFGLLPPEGRRVFLWLSPGQPVAVCYGCPRPLTQQPRPMGTGERLCRARGGGDAPAGFGARPALIPGSHLSESAWICRHFIGISACMFLCGTGL